MKRLYYITTLLLAVLCLAACTITISDDGEIEITQTVNLKVEPSSLQFTADGSTQSVKITTNSESWKITASADWATLSANTGKGDQEVSVTVGANSGERRQLTLTVADQSGSKKSAGVTVTQEAKEWEEQAVVPSPAAFDGNKLSSTTYQLLIYSFADSDGDNIGDFKGIQSKLDYLDALGVTALWLSPAHPTNSYHAYDVNDYNTVNSLYGSEADFKALVDAAHAKGIKIYMDYVLNHSGTGNEWFKSVKADPVNSPYKDYYVLSDDPSADVAAKKIDNFAGQTSPGMGTWHSLGNGDIGYKGLLHFKLDWGNKTITVTKETSGAQNSNASAKMWLWIGSVGAVGLYETSTNIYEITYDVDTDWGFLIRSSLSTWDNNTKWGAKAGASKITFGQPLAINSSDPQNIVFGSTTYYFASFDGSMPDLNYGKYTECENSPAFKAIAATADRWITEFGVDGFRLDAVIWVYQTKLEANQRFLDQWYQHCNTTYHNADHTDDIFMVGEAWEDHSRVEQYYYKGLTSCFEFNYGGLLSGVLNDKNASAYASSVAGYINDHTTQRADAITSLFLTNHDQDRWAEWVGKSTPKEKQAAAMLLTSGGKPFIYQGEELGYWGNKGKGDEYVRTPILWDKAGKDCAKKGVNNKVDSDMLKSSISVEAQLEDAGSLLNVYKAWSQLRNTYPALAEGKMESVSLGGNTIASWYMTSGSQKLLVIHNVSANKTVVNVASHETFEKPIALLGSATVKGGTLTLSGNSSVVFEL